MQAERPQGERQPEQRGEQGGGSGADEALRMRRIADFIAGMTDRYALIEHARLFPSTPELR
jgi:dGTP triphosphohydrolase